MPAGCLHPPGYGGHRATTGSNAGVEGATWSADPNASGVHGRSVSPTPGRFTTGVEGLNQAPTSDNGIGVFGLHAGGGNGVHGLSSHGIGVFGLHEDTTGTDPGVRSETISIDVNAVGVTGIVELPVEIIIGDAKFVLR